ncbi:CRE-UGT-49 protein [Aphelenchoides avenae]|nr:CRE-UGT-49 protein [Aphelenchus avenae]
MEHMSSVLGVPIQPSYVPGVMFSDGYSDRMSYFERVGNLFETTVNFFAFRKIRDLETATFRKHFGSHFPHANDIAKESALTLVSVDEFTDFPRPILHNHVYIGGLGLHESSTKPLEEPFKSEMEKGAEGIVFVSFGSIMPTKHFPEAVRSNVIRALAELPQFHFILKIDKGDEVTAAVARNASNVFTTSWAPQPLILDFARSEILGIREITPDRMAPHPRLRSFVTHGGYNSLVEAASHGVPLLLTGFFGDQMRNARVVERNGWGIAFDKHELKKSHVPFKEAIRTLVENKM